MPSILRHREFYVALLAIAAGAGALFVMKDLSWGNLRRTGPALVPGAIAIVLLIAGIWHLLRTVVAASPRRQARTGYSWLDLLPWAVLVALMLLASAMRVRPPAVLLRMGPAEYAAAWVLLLCIVFAASWIAERGALARLAIAMLLGLLCALGGIDVSSGVTRFWQDDLNFMHGVLAGALVVALRLPVVGFVIAFALAPQIEEQFRRTMLLSADDPLIFVTRPVSAVLLGIAAVIIVAVLVGRFSGRRRR